MQGPSIQRKRIHTKLPSVWTQALQLSPRRVPKEEFKEKLDMILATLTDQPKIGNLVPSICELILLPYTVCSLYSVKKYLFIAQAEMHPGSQNMMQNFPDARTF